MIIIKHLQNMNPISAFNNRKEVDVPLNKQNHPVREKDHLILRKSKHRADTSSGKISDDFVIVFI